MEAAFTEQLRHNRADAFTVIYEQYRVPIYNYLYRLSGSRDVADDLTHDTFLSAYEALPRLRTDSTLCAWLYCIASNRFRDLLRRRKLVDWFSFGDTSACDPFLAEAGGEECIPEQELVRSALRSLKPDYAICLTLRLAEGFSTEETAAIMRTTPDVIRMRLSRARQMFKVAYNQLEHGECQGGEAGPV